MDRSLYWLRQDLRIRDNPALFHATQQGQCSAVVIISPLQWQLHDDAQCKINFYVRQLIQLQQHFQALNIAFIIKIIPLWADIPEYLLQLCQRLEISAIYANQENGLNEKKRDAAVQAILAKHHKKLHLFTDRTLFSPASIRNKTGQPYRLFSAFKKVCYARLIRCLPASYPDIKQQAYQLTLAEPNQTTLIEILQQYPVQSSLQDLWPVGEDFAQQKLQNFIMHQVQHYHLYRDQPAYDATSQLSAYLTSGMLSVRQCVHALMAAYQGEFQLNSQGVQVWLDEILWREFYQHLLFDFDKLSKHRPFKDDMCTIAWRDSAVDFEKWATGQTGIPMVDAGMRQLLQTGWMHNRLRMICAMFLCKNLLIDWRKGEKWFMQHLIDGDLAANNGGWQWSASTGTDALPYFRMFNPITQSKRFDADGEYLKTWLPELRHLDKRVIHAPFAHPGQDLAGYPQPMLELKASRERALHVFSLHS